MRFFAAEHEIRVLTRIVLLAALACLLMPPAHARTVREKKLAARSQFETAERLREALEGKPQSQRVRRDYQKVMDAYRKVYYTAPTSIKADSSVLAVAELLDEQGRVLNDPKSFKNAIGQLEFLRREYPGSKLRAEALFTIAEIYRDDLEDVAQAKAAFAEFLKHYPRDGMAPKARQAMEEIEAAAQAGKSVSTRTAKVEPPSKGAAHESLVESRSGSQEPNPDSRDGSPEGATERHRLPLLTGIRHWSTPDYTRVAIDLEQEVEYEAGRVPKPDRIFFDLHNIKLAAGLGGKSFDVDDGFLHRIRVAQYKANLARVVLDVDDVAEYSAFLLPNPYRLIIDIHGRAPARLPGGNNAAGNNPLGNNAAERPPAHASTSSSLAGVLPEPSGGSSSLREPPASASNAAGRQSAQLAPESKTPSTGAIEIAKAEPLKTDSTKGAEIKSADLKTADLKTAAPKIIEEPKTIEDTRIDQDKATRKPTSAPTFQSVEPHASGKKPREAMAHAAAPTSSGQRSLIRALGLKIGKIVIDAGHGGHDTGTIGPNGLMEKDLVLDVALKLGRMLENKLGAEVVYTRDDDTFVPLETRTAIANKEQADLFVSIHANSSHDAAARGVETYYLNFTSSADALEVAARENAVSEKSIHELQDLVKKIALKEKIEESREFAADVDKSLYSGLAARSPGLRDRGVKKAPFIVLIGANMPSILSEISFVSNPADEKRLKTGDYRQRIAESLYRGISKYVNGLSGVKIAAKTPAEKAGE